MSFHLALLADEGFFWILKAVRRSLPAPLVRQSGPGMCGRAGGAITP